jgi:uncharacterized membrane protein
MAFCANCGAPVEGSFCTSCGKPVGSAPAPPGAGATAAPGLQSNVAGALCYLLGLITGILFLVLEPYNKDRGVRFHAFQSIFLNLAVIAVMIAFSIIGTILAAIFGSIIPLLGAAVISLVGMAVWLACLVLWLYMMIKTYNGSKVVLPVIGPLAEKQAG